jgi:hypothetical protein
MALSRRLSTPRRPRDQFRKRHVQRKRDIEQGEHPAVVPTALETSDDIGVDPGRFRQRLLSQVALFAALPNLITQRLKDRSAHNADSDPWTR